ncbi:MAG: hypothetical protein Q9211_000401 [Gyalolechia sp. 1 TL-2023]
MIDEARSADAVFEAVWNAVRHNISDQHGVMEDIAANGLSDVQIAEIKRVYGTSFKTCRPHFEQAFKKFFTDAWWPAKLQQYGEALVMRAPEGLKIKLVRAGFLHFLEEQWFCVGDHATPELEPMRPMVQYYRVELFDIIAEQKEQIKSGKIRAIQASEALDIEEYENTLCGLLKDVLPEEDWKDLVHEFV